MDNAGWDNIHHFQFACPSECELNKSQTAHVPEHSLCVNVKLHILKTTSILALKCFSHNGPLFPKAFYFMHSFRGSIWQMYLLYLNVNVKLHILFIAIHSQFQHGFGYSVQLYLITSFPP